MSKIRKNDALRAITMFLLDDDTEERYKQKVAFR